MVLTREEQKSVLRMVIESHQGITISEVRSNQSIKEEMILNLKFYSGLKETFLSNKNLKEGFSTGIGFIDAIINTIGGIKDLLTGSDLFKWFSQKIKNIADKFFPSLRKNASDWTDKLSKFFKKVAQIFGPPFIAYIIAWVKKGFKRPNKGEILAERNLASKIYQVILVILITIAIIKLLIYITPFATAAAAASAGTAATTASVSGALVGAFKSAGIWGNLAGAFNILGLVTKIKHLSHEAGIEAAEDIKQTAIDDLQKTLSSVSQEKSVSSPFGKDDYYNTEESLQMKKLAGII